MAKTNAAEPEEKTETGDAPLIDLNEASVKKLMARAKKRGYITYDEINEALPQDQMSSEQIEDVMSAFSEMGVNIVENEEADEDDQQADADAGVDEVDGVGETFVLEKKKETVDRTDDPVRMYLREMGAVELLSREGEIAIAKRIEAGRDTMIWGLCESPITFNAIIGWSNALNEGRMQLREIIDLEAMLSKGPTAEQLNETEQGGEGGGEGEISEKVAGPSIKEEEEVADEPEADANEDDEDMVERRTQPQAEEEDEDNTLSLAQMEETLTPQALEKFAEITSLYKKFSKVQAHRMDAFAAAQDFPTADEKKYQKLREQPTAEVESVQFHGSKIEYLVEQLYSYNRRLTALGGQMLRLAERHRVPRRAFLESYMGHELDEAWPESVAQVDKKFAAFAAAEADTVERIRSEISAIAQQTGTSLGAF